MMVTITGETKGKQDFLTPTNVLVQNNYGEQIMGLNEITIK